MSNTIDDMKRYCRPGSQIVLEDDTGTNTTFLIKPLKMDYYPEFYIIMSAMEDLENSKGNKEQLFTKMIQENMVTIVKLLKNTVAHSFNLAYDKNSELFDLFISNNFIDLFNGMIEANTDGLKSRNAKALDKLRELQQKRQEDVKPDNK